VSVRICRRARGERGSCENFTVTDELPDAIRIRVRALPEFRMGVHRVGVRLMSGIKVDNVLVSSGRVTRVLGRDRVPFDAAEVVDVTDQSELPLPADQ
jgi:hypothetical protein